MSLSIEEVGLSPLGALLDNTAGEGSAWSTGFKLPDLLQIDPWTVTRCDGHPMPRDAAEEINMPSGGARNRSGPQPDPNSLKSAKRGITLTALPAEGYDGEAPVFPLPRVLVYDVWFEDKVRHKDLDDTATSARYERELELWAWAWRTPQAAAWSMEPWRWQTVAIWVRTMAVCESGDATAADKNSLHRFADQIGMTPAGLRENGWKIATDQVAAKRAEKAPVGAARPLARDRLKAVGGGS